MRILLDTNLLSRLANASDPNQKLAEKAIETVRLAGYRPCIVPQNIYEFWVVATRPKEQNGLGMSLAAATTEVMTFKSLFPLCEDSPAVFLEWERVIAANAVVGKTAHDARLVAAMIVHGISHILTFNVQDFRRYSGITVLSPDEATKLPQSK
jgi:predicted nucleic acid-binding protein